MALVMMALGRYRFGLGSAAYRSLRRAGEYRWPALDRVGRAPARQFTGPGAETIELDGVILPHFKGGLGQLAAMRAEAGLGMPLRLVAGTTPGRDLSQWVIERIEESQSAFTADGTPSMIEFRLQLGFYGEDS